ncbi:MAG TPA: undecaprenyldiphospho-muramoylpentapeptide beta-N-acetylglucosaminyltransferase [Chthoniobacteraceae bacterium]|jgi:UDP-N-acetylglucosamine--N-acetylmuramyl-(pentapeptide) pyrophosphoryl-undecaprenol N-acetylglucosamine transferase
MKFVIAAGGTGGHLFPGLAVGEAMLARGHQVMLLISEKEIDSLATRGRSEFRIERVPGVGLPKLLSPAVFSFLRRFRSGLKRCHELFSDFQPNAVLGMGGFTSTAPILAGRKRKAPTFVHESNAIPGKANRLNGRLVSCVLLGFEECRKYFPKAKCEVTGTPVRATLAEKLPKEKALAIFKLTPERRTLLVMGGSQGAHGLNQAVAAALPGLKDQVQVVHLSGSQDEQMLRETYQRAGIPAFVAAFHHRMEEAYSAADLAIARSGAASLTELSHFALPSILSPYPFAAEDHQTLNAQIFDRAGAGVLLPERDATPEVLAAKLRWLLDDPARLSEMSACSAKLAPHGAAERVAETILRHCSV